MKKTLSLEDYLKNIEKKKKDGAVVSDEKAGKLYQTVLTRETDAAAKLSPDYGVTAEKLGKAGLSSSGFRDYLQAGASAKEEAAPPSAFGAYLSNLRYAEKESSPAPDYAKISASVFSTLRSAGIVKYETAYRYAKMQGLDDAYAKEAATLAVTQNEDDFVNRTIVGAVKNRDARVTTLAYAYARGLSERGLAAINEFYNQYSGDKTELPEIKELYESIAKH